MASPEDLYLVDRDGIFYVHGTIDGKRIRRSCETRDRDRAEDMLDSMRREYFSGWRLTHDDHVVNWKEVAAGVHDRHRASARVRNMVFDLRPSDVYAMMQATGFRCSVSGVPFSKSAMPRDPWAPSIDRIENRHGYIRDNVRVVSLAANIAMSNWGLDVLLRLARGIVRSADQVSPEQELTRPVHIVSAETAQVLEIVSKIGT